jgi:hypothetical protein
LYCEIAPRSIVQNVESHDMKPLILFAETAACILDESIVEAEVAKANAAGIENLQDFVEFDSASYIQAQLLELEGLSLRSAVSFSDKNGLTGNLRNAEVNSTSTFLSEFSSSFWSKQTGQDLGSTVFLNLLNSWTGSVTSYLSNGRDPACFHFVARDDYLVEPFIEPDEKVPLVHLPVDLKHISLRVDGSYLNLKKKPDLGMQSKMMGDKRIFSSDSLRLSFDENSKVEEKIELKACLLDPATANPLVDADAAKYHPGFAKLILNTDTGKYSLRIPTSIERPLASLKTQESRKVEQKNRFHERLPGCHSFSNV